MLTATAAFTSLLGLVAAAPFGASLPNGFPSPNQAAISQIQKDAGGTLPNTAAPTGLNDDTLTSLKLIAFNEIFEVAYFTELHKNVTSNVPGYTLAPNVRGPILSALAAIIAQEELHALNANGILAANKVAPIEACKYNVPVSTFDQAIALAQTFTDVVLGTLGDVQANAVTTAGAPASGLVRALSSVIGQEGQQDGTFRLLQHKRPSAEPFLTASARDFAWTALQGFTVPGSCPSADNVPLKVFKGMTLLTKDPKNGPIEFSLAPGANVDPSCQRVALINGQNSPIIETFTVSGKDGQATKITADFPKDKFVMDGLTIAAVIDATNATDVDDVAKKAIWGPGLIESM